MQKMKPDPRLSLCTSMNSQWIIDLNIKPKTLKQLQDIGNKSVGIGTDFVNGNLIVQ
jgi:hypothetical protein